MVIGISPKTDFNYRVLYKL